MTEQLRIVLGNQLFPLEHLPSAKSTTIFMAEDMSLCTYVRHHSHKLVLFLAAMRGYAEQLRDAGFDVVYHSLGDTDTGSYEEKLSAAVNEIDPRSIAHFEIEDHAFAARIDAWAEATRIERRVETSPMFLCSRDRFCAYLDDVKSPSMAEFYRRERIFRSVMTDADDSPRGGKWSFDADNRKKLPRSVTPPELPAIERNQHVEDVIQLVEQRFDSHPGAARDFSFPVTRSDALMWLEDFLETRFELFGPYEDAISTRSRTVFHSLLSPLLNLGLITPDEVLQRVLEHAEEADVPLNSLEGFVRQLIGWREFVRGIYHNFDAEQSERNFWNHTRSLSYSWYDATTGVDPLDDAIRNAIRYGWDHHIIRLMVVANLMTLSEIRPAQAHEWFMEHYVDSSEWVMGPNVYGMGIFSDGGIFATKPYICGSNYLRKMSDYGKGDWCDVVDGLYWRFIGRHQDYFAANPRLSMMARQYEKLSSERRERIFPAAESFIERNTHQQN